MATRFQNLSEKSEIPHFSDLEAAVLTPNFSLYLQESKCFIFPYSSVGRFRVLHQLFKSHTVSYVLVVQYWMQSKKICKIMFAMLCWTFVYS
uniref:Glycosyl transferase family 2 family protein n=1 Tax=Rhizophora mucronata TaxID=61149 RepID=A0A2P2LSD9_RHIMU